MKRILQGLGLVILMATAFIWAANGAKLGWTKTEAEIKTIDPVTGIDGITYEKKFQPGVDFLAAGIIASIAVTVVSFLFRTPSKSTNNP